MKLGSITVGRNDGYKDIERGIIHFNSLLETFDEVTYIDWNSPSGSYLWELEPYLPKTGKIKHYIIPPSVVNSIIQHPNAQKCNEAISRNIGIRRSEADWIVSTNLDIIAPSRQELEDSILKSIDELIILKGGTKYRLDKCFWTISRREAPKEIIEKYKPQEWKKLRNELIDTIQERHFPARVSPKDDYSLINCCGDFQLAHKDAWEKIKGFEEDMIFACFVDTNVQKKAVLNGFELEALYNPPIFHMEHGSYYTKKDGTRVSDEGQYKGDQQAYNDVWDYVEFFEKTTNNEYWGLGGIEIEYERI